MSNNKLPELWNMDGSFSAYVEPDAKSKPVNEKTGMSLSVAAIMPVYYTGNKIYADDDPKAYDSNAKLKKGISPILKVKVTDAALSKELICEEDYTLSYKNNINAASESDKKAPVVIITGKGDYKGIKVRVPFTIAPAKLADFAVINAGNSRYFKYGRKGFAAKYTALHYDENGKAVKLNKKSYRLKYYDESGRFIAYDLVSENNAANTDCMTKYFVTAEAVDAGNFYGETDFDISDAYDNSIAYGIPASSKTLTVKLEGKAKVDYEENKKLEDMFKIKEVKVGRKSLSSDSYSVKFLNSDKSAPLDDQVVKEAGKNSLNERQDISKSPQEYGSSCGFLLYIHGIISRQIFLP